jgi:hypothetical protein
MFQLDKQPKKVEEEYIKRFLPKLEERIKNGSKGIKLNCRQKSVLLPNWRTDKPDESILKKLLIGQPKEIKDLNDQIMSEMEGRFTNQIKLLNRLLHIFDYERVFDNSKSTSYWLARKIGRNTCTYCNRIYTFTVVRGKGKNDRERIARPTFDHWFPKDKYPLLSLSLYNLIPSCPICNSSVKGNTYFSLEKYIHPYVKEQGHPKFEFIPDKTTEVHPKWTVQIKRAEGSKEDNTIKAFALDDMYHMHGPLEVTDIMNFKECYPDNYLKTLVTKVLNDSNGKLTIQDVYSILFGTDLNPDHYLDRPLSKMKRDLLKYLKIIEVH